MKYLQKSIRNKKHLYKEAVYDQFARIGKALGNSKRLELLDLLSQGARTVEALAQEARLSMASTSQHLRILRSARLVESRKKGLFVIYQLADEQVAKFFLSLRDLAFHQLAELDRLTRDFFGRKRGLEAIDRRTLLRKVKRGEVIVLDVRPIEEYQAGHLPRAISIPLKELTRRLNELPREKAIVAYCRGPYCLLAVEAVEFLQSKGYRALRFEESVQDWQAHGLLVERELSI